jgi:cytochrome c biogenesis protein ResB
MLSPGATFWSIFLFIDACIVIGLTGERSYTVSWVFIAILLFLQTVLFFVILRGCRAQTPTGARLGEIRWRFLLNHVGLLLALGAGFWGAPDSVTMRVKAFEGQQVKEAVIPGIGLSGIEHEILLKDFRLERYENGVPSLYEADLTVNGEKVNLRVNHPYRLSFSEMLYLSGYDVNAGEESSWCVMQIVHEPWRYWAFAGVLMMLAGAFMLFIQGPKRGNVIND